MSTTLSMRWAPSMRVWAPGRSWARCSIWASARYRMSLTSVDLPEPDTPVTHVNVPSGMVTDWALRLGSRGSWIGSVLPGPLAAGGGHLDRARAREELTGERL